MPTTTNNLLVTQEEVDATVLADLKQRQLNIEKARLFAETDPIELEISALLSEGWKVISERSNSLSDHVEVMFDDGTCILKPRVPGWVLADAKAAVKDTL